MPEDETEGMLDRSFLKRLYMGRVEQFEAGDEVMKNRLILRKYLRELFHNQVYSR